MSQNFFLRRKWTSLSETPWILPHTSNSMAQNTSHFPWYDVNNSVNAHPDTVSLVRHIPVLQSGYYLIHLYTFPHETCQSLSLSSESLKEGPLQLGAYLVSFRLPLLEVGLQFVCGEAHHGVPGCGGHPLPTHPRVLETLCCRGSSPKNKHGTGEHFK